MGRRALDLTGQQFGRLYVVRRVCVGRHLCRCSCGIEKYIATQSLTRRNEASKSCGCLQRESASNVFKIHGEANPPTLEYTAWSNMKARCFDQNTAIYAYYGGRGITVCSRWLDYKNFLKDMGRKPSKNHSLDRINNDGNYELTNCRWATKSDQMLNRRSWTWSGEAKKEFKRRACHRILTHR